MDKTQFTYQRWFLRVFLVLSIILSIIVIAASLPYEGFWFHLISNLAVCVIVHFYFTLMKRCKWFICEGTYWVEDGVVFIEKGKKTHSLNGVKAVYGTTISYLGYAKSGMLRIDYGNKKKVILISRSTEGIENFSDCDLYALLETVLEHNPNLQKSDDPDFFYELKE